MGGHLFGSRCSRLQWVTSYSVAMAEVRYSAILAGHGMDAAAGLRVVGKQPIVGEGGSLEQVHSSMVNPRKLFPPVRSHFLVFSLPPGSSVKLQIHQPIHEALELSHFATKPTTSPLSIACTGDQAFSTPAFRAGTF